MDCLIHMTSLTDNEHASHCLTITSYAVSDCHYDKHCELHGVQGVLCAQSRPLSPHTWYMRELLTRIHR
jgi:hypothetical protein